MEIFSVQPFGVILEPVTDFFSTDKNGGVHPQYSTKNI